MEKQKLVITLVVFLCISLSAVGYFATTKSRVAGSIEQVQLDLEKAQGDLTKVRADLETTQAQLAESREKLVSETNKIKVFETNLAQKEEQLAKATDDLKKKTQILEVKLKESAEKSAALQNDLATVKSQIAKLTSSYEQTKAQLAAAQQQAQDLKTQDQGTSEKVRSLSAENDKLQQKVKDLEAQLKQKKKLAKIAAEKAAEKADAVLPAAKADSPEANTPIASLNPDGKLATDGVFTQGEEKKVATTFDLTYVSKYMSKGGESYGQKGGLFKTISFDFWDSGFGASVKHRNSTSGGYVDQQRFDYILYYKNQLFDDQPYETKYKISWSYEHYPGLARNKANTTHEWSFGFSWPQLFANGIVPYYIAAYEYPAGSSYAERDITGWVHVFGGGYDMAVAELPEPLHLSADVSYLDGLGGDSKDHDWSHATLGVSTKFKITGNLSFVPGLYHQISMDDSVCKRDVTYCELSMKYKF